jgi:aminocarboxymuconate-semialdehyde decarboxylase
MVHAHSARSDCRRRISQDPLAYLKRLHFDTVVFSTAQLEFLVREYGADHIVLGSDYPYDMSEPDPVGFVNRAHGLSAADKAGILGVNAARLLGLGSEDLQRSRAWRTDLAP